MNIYEWIDKEQIIDKGNPPEWSDDPREYISDLAEFKDKIHHFEKYYANGTIPNNTPIYHYTLNSTSVNKRLWKHKLGILPITELGMRGVDFLKETKNLNANITSKTPIPEDFHVYSGLSTKDCDLHKVIANNDILHYPSFISTSISPHVTNTHLPAFDVDKHLIRIHIPKNSRNGAYISKVSHFPDEHEYLIKSNTVLKFNKKPTQIGNHTYLWDAHIMDDDEIKANQDNKEVQSYLKMKEILK